MKELPGVFVLVLGDGLHISVPSVSEETGGHALAC